jgi:hypothetical protein
MREQLLRGTDNRSRLFAGSVKTVLGDTVTEVCVDAKDLKPTNRGTHARGVFLYFPSLDYSREVLDRMVQKARHGVMILDVPDLAKRDEAMALRRRMAGEEVYAQKYEGLNHLYFDKAWFETNLAALGVRRMRIEDQQIQGYANSTYRFNVFGWPSAV